MAIALKQSWILSGTFLNLLTCGYHLGYPTILLRDLKATDSEIHMSLETESWVGTISSVAISSLPSLLIISPILQIYGRKIAHIAMILPNLVACLILYFAHDVTTLLIARLVNGFTIGSLMFVAAIIVGEYSSPEYRGIFLNVKSASGTFGIFLAHFIGIFFDWRTTALIGVIPSVLSLLNTLTWPESPAWLAYKGKYEDCQKSFKWLRGDSHRARKELLLLIQTQKNRRLSQTKHNSKLTKFKHTVSKLVRKDFIKPSLIVLFVFVILESCGRHSFSSYAVKFMSAFTTESGTTLYYVVAVDAVIFLSSVCSCGLVKLFRRRTILFVSGGLACGLLISICVYLYLKSIGKAPENNVWLPMTLLILYFIVLNAGVASIALSLLGEIYPLEHRGFGSFISGILFSLAILASLKVTPALIRDIDVYGTFFIYALFMAGALIYLFLFLPETEGKTLQEIEHHFNGISLVLQPDIEEQLLNSKL